MFSLYPSSTLAGPNTQVCLCPSHHYQIHFYTIEEMSHFEFKMDDEGVSNFSDVQYVHTN